MFSLRSETGDKLTSSRRIEFFNRVKMFWWGICADPSLVWRVICLARVIRQIDYHSVEVQYVEFADAAVAAFPVYPTLTVSPFAALLHISAFRSPPRNLRVKRALRMLRRAGRHRHYEPRVVPEGCAGHPSFMANVVSFNRFFFFHCLVVCSVLFGRNIVALIFEHCSLFIASGTTVMNVVRRCWRPLSCDSNHLMKNFGLDL